MTKCRHPQTVARVALKFGESSIHLERTVKSEALDDIRHFIGSTGMAPGSLVAAEIRRLSDQSELSGAGRIRWWWLAAVCCDSAVCARAVLRRTDSEKL